MDKKGLINFSDWEKIDIRVGKVLSSEKVPNADKLLKLEVDFGPEGKKQILTGMAEYYEPKYFVGKQVTAIINLEPRKMKGLESQGMILAASEGDGEKPILLQPESKAKNGSVIK